MPDHDAIVQPVWGHGVTEPELPEVVLALTLDQAIVQERATGDQGADLLFSHSGVRVVVHCKRYVKSVGNKAVQEAHAARGFYNCDRALVVTSSTFTSSARALADALDVALVAGSDIAKIGSFVGVLARAR